MNVPTTVSPAARRRHSTTARRARLLLHTVEVACLLSAPPADLCHRRAMSEQLPGVHGDRLAPIAVIVTEAMGERERLATFYRVLSAHRRQQVANDTAGSAVVSLASRRPVTPTALS